MSMDLRMRGTLGIAAFTAIAARLIRRVLDVKTCSGPCGACSGRYNVRTGSGSGSVVEHLLAKEGVAGSNPVFRSIFLFSLLAEVAELVDAADSKIAWGEPRWR